MKRFIPLLYVIAGILVLSLVIAFAYPTLNQQVTFNEYLWHHYPATKIRYYMSDSLLAFLNTQKPTYTETHQLLGEDFWDTWPGLEQDSLDRPRELVYLLKSDFVDLYGATWMMAIDFDESGNYKESHRWHED